MAAIESREAASWNIDSAIWIMPRTLIFTGVNMSLASVKGKRLEREASADIRSSYRILTRRASSGHLPKGGGSRVVRVANPFKSPSTDSKSRSKVRSRTNPRIPDEARILYLRIPWTWVVCAFQAEESDVSP